jgi:hypothetical protein
MRCKDIQEHLAIDAQLSQLQARDRTHMLQCPDCRQVQSIYAEIDNELREQPIWQPPPGFAERVSLQGLTLMRESSASARSFSERFVEHAVLDFSSPILLGLLTAGICLLILLNGSALVNGYPGLVAAFSKALLANANQLAWSMGILSLGFSAWITKRALTKGL